jgi:Serine kinase of the HPr protein, regulates carbohydrate metabolism
MKIQATGFVYQGKGILLTGDPGIGKTSLMLEMIRSGGQLVGDDGVRSPTITLNP